MKTVRKLWVIVLFAALAASVVFPAFARDTTLSPPQLTIRFAPSPGAFPEGVSGVRTGFFGFRVDYFPEPVPPAGYTFIGWFSDGAEVHGPIAAVRSTTILAGYAPEVDAEIAPSFALVYNPGLGQLPYGTPPIQSFTYGSVLVNLPVPTRGGYYFAGWQLGGEPVAAPHIVRSDMALEAVWSDIPLAQSSRPVSIPANHFVAVFNPFPGVFAGNVTGISFGRPGTAIAELPPNPVRQGYDFYGWRMPGGAELDALPIMHGDIAMHAIWQAANDSQPGDPEATPGALIPTDTRPNPSTSPTTISLMIFAAVVAFGIAVAGLHSLGARHTAAKGKYSADLTRRVREMDVIKRSRDK